MVHENLRAIAEQFHSGKDLHQIDFGAAKLSLEEKLKRLDSAIRKYPTPDSVWDGSNEVVLAIKEKVPVAASVLQVHHHLQGHPISSSAAICKAEGLTAATVNKALDHLVDLGLVKEITGGQRNRLFAYDRVLMILAEGTEP